MYHSATTLIFQHSHCTRMFQAAMSTHKSYSTACWDTGQSMRLPRVSLYSDWVEKYAIPLWNSKHQLGQRRLLLGFFSLETSGIKENVAFISLLHIGWLSLPYRNSMELSNMAQHDSDEECSSKICFYDISLFMLWKSVGELSFEKYW